MPPMKRAIGIPKGPGSAAWTVLALLAIGLTGCEEPAQREGESNPLREQRGTLEGQRNPPPPVDPAAWADAVAGAEIDESVLAQTVYVDPAKGDDSATGGNRGAPLRTLAAAVDVAAKFLEAGQGVRIRLAVGTYREEVTVHRPDAPGAPLVIEGEANGRVILTGSDDWSDADRWQPVEGRPGILSAPWPREWGDTRVHVSGRPEGDHPPCGVRGLAPDDGTAVLEWQPPAGRAQIAGYRVERKDTAFDPQEHETPWRTVTQLPAATGRLVDESVEGAGPDAVRLTSTVSSPWPRADGRAARRPS